MKDKCNELQRKLNDSQERRKAEVTEEQNRQRMEIEEINREFTHKIEIYERNILELKTKISETQNYGGSSSVWEEKYRILETNLS